MQTGDSVGPYVIQSRLGAGGMGQVYRAHDARLGRDVALKQLSDRSLASDLARRRVLQEARAAAALSHPHIAAIFDVLDTPDGPLIVMEYVPGESLAALIARGALPPARALDIGVQIAKGLADAHRHGIVHRDLKPANIQITPGGIAKILDFGIARITATPAEQQAAPTMTAGAEAGRLVGTPGYMAPEQLAGGSADERTDVYALGVVLYEMLTGCAPFAGGDLFQSAMAVLKGGARQVVDLVPSTPPLISAIVERAMAPDPAARFQTAGEMAIELQRARTLVSGPQSHGTGVADGGRRQTMRLALVTLVLIAMAGMGWQWTRGTEAVAVAEGSVFAVLPFRNATGSALDDPIAVGLTDAVANRLSSLESIRVLSVEASRDAATAGRDAAGAARALGARFVVDGEMRRNGQSLDVNVALVNADGSRSPAGRFTGDIAQIFDLHQRIAQGVIAAMAGVDAAAGAATPSGAPTLNQDAFAEYAQARVFLERSDVPGNLDHAIRLFQSAIARDARFALAYAGLGQAYWAQYTQTGETRWTTPATAAVLDALRIDPLQPEVRLSLAVMYQGLGRLDDAEEEVRKVVALQPWNDDAHRLLGGVHIDRSAWDAAVAALNRAIELRPNYWRNHSELGFAHFQSGRADLALKAYERVVELQPDSALGFHMLGTLHQSAGRLPEALANYETASRIRPRWSTYSNIGTIRFWSGDYAKAADAYERALKLAPATPRLHINLGDAREKLGERSRARASYQSAVDEIRRQLGVNAQDADNLSLLALSLAKLGDRAGAGDASARALQLNPQHGEVLYAAAVVEALAGRTAEACSHLGAAVARGTSVEIVRQAGELRVLRGCEAYDRLITQ